MGRSGQMLVVTAAAVITASVVPFAGKFLATTVSNPFADALPDWAQESILKLNRQGVIKGYEDGRFGPGDPLTNGQTVTLLWRMLAYEHFLQEPGHCAQRYDDIPPSHYAFVPLCVFRAQGWTTSDSRFHPDAPQTRRGVVELLSTVLGPTLRSVLKDVSADRQNFGDVPAGHPLAETTELLRAAGIFTGNADGSAGLETPLNRAAVAVLLHRALTRLHDFGIRALQGVDDYALYAPDEPRFSLDLDAKMLPTGVGQAEVSVTQSETTEGIPNGIKPTALFTLKPDGLKLKTPVRFSVTLPIKDGSIPVPLHVSDSVAELVPELKALQNPAQRTVTLTGLLSHFSALVFTIGGNLIDASAPDTVGPFRVGESFSVPVTITNLEGDGRFVAEHVRISPPPMGRNGPFVETTSFRTGGYSVTPDHIRNVPPPDTTMAEKTATYQGMFTCVRPGGDSVIYEADVDVDYSYDPKGWSAGMGNGGSMLAQVSTMTQVECRGPHIADWLKDVSIQTQCGGSVTIDGKLTDHPEDVQSVTMAFTRLVQGNWGSVSGGGKTSFDAGTGRFHWAADLEPGYYGYQATVTLKNGISYLLHSSQFEITPCGEQPPIRIPFGDSFDTGPRIMLDDSTARSSSSSVSSLSHDSALRIQLGTDATETIDSTKMRVDSTACQDNFRECDDLKRECDRLLNTMKKKRRACSAQIEKDCEDEVFDLTDEWESCDKRYDTCTLRNKYTECLRGTGDTFSSAPPSIVPPSSALSPASSLSSVSERTIISSSSAPSTVPSSASSSSSYSSSHSTASVPTSSSSAAVSSVVSSSSVQGFICCETCPSTAQDRFYLPFAGDDCQPGDARRNDLTQTTCVNQLYERPEELPLVYGPACPPQ